MKLDVLDALVVEHGPAVVYRRSDDATDRVTVRVGDLNVAQLG